MQQHLYSLVQLFIVMNLCIKNIVQKLFQNILPYILILLIIASILHHCFIDLNALILGRFLQNLRIKMVNIDIA
jgi:hypothetical protein